MMLMLHFQCFNCGNKAKVALRSVCLAFVWFGYSRGYNAGKDENCFAQEKLILVVESTQPKILKISNEQNMTSCLQNIF